MNVSMKICSFVGLKGLAAQAKLIFANTTVKCKSSEGGLVIPRRQLNACLFVCLFFPGTIKF